MGWQFDIQEEKKAVLKSSGLPQGNSKNVQDWASHTSGYFQMFLSFFLSELDPLNTQFLHLSSLFFFPKLFKTTGVWTSIPASRNGGFWHVMIHGMVRCPVRLWLAHSVLLKWQDAARSNLNRQHRLHHACNLLLGWIFSSSMKPVVVGWEWSGKRHYPLKISCWVMSFALMSSEKKVMRYPSPCRSAVQTQQQPPKAFSAAWQTGT